MRLLPLADFICIRKVRVRKRLWFWLKGRCRGTTTSQGCFSSTKLSPLFFLRVAKLQFGHFVIPRAKRWKADRLFILLHSDSLVTINLVSIYIPLF
jgi:hypothetical protein